MVLFHSSSLAIWLGTIFFALSMSNVFPCSLAMVEQYFPVNGKTITKRIKDMARLVIEYQNRPKQSEEITHKSNGHFLLF